MESEFLKIHIRNPSNFSELKTIIQRVLMRVGKKNLPTAIENFMINSN